MKFAVIDVETTGLDPLRDRIIEIGIVLIEDNEEISRYSHFLNPGKPVPGNITSLTGITSDMVASAPCFEKVAHQIDELIQGYTLVGHHVHFDYSFMKNEMKMAGISFSRKTLCTAELSRLIFPGRKSHSLKSLGRYFGVQNQNPHRALPDAVVTAQIFLHISEKFGSPFIESLLKKENNILAETLELISEKVKNLPVATGVYYFIGKDDKPLYIGKAKNIRSRVLSHFRGDGQSVKLLAVSSQIKDIRYYVTGNELLAALHEDHEIRHYWPRFNNAQKSYNKRFGVVYFPDMKNRWRMAVASACKTHCCRVFFHQYHLADEYIRQRVDRFGLNGNLCGITDQQKEDVSADSHNKAFENMLTLESEENRLEVYYTSGRNKNERGFILIENAIYKGFGFVPDNEPITASILKKNLVLRYSSVTVENLLKHLRKKSEPQLLIDNSIFNDGEVFKQVSVYNS